MNGIEFPFNLMTSEGTVIECVGEGSAVVLSYRERFISIIDDELVEFIEVLTSIAKEKGLPPTQGDENEKAPHPPVRTEGIRLPEGAIPAIVLPDVYHGSKVRSVAVVRHEYIDVLPIGDSTLNGMSFDRSDLISMLALLDKGTNG